MKVCEEQTFAPLSVSSVRVNVRTDGGHIPSEDIPYLVDIVSLELPLISGDQTRPLREHHHASSQLFANRNGN